MDSCKNIGMKQYCKRILSLALPFGLLLQPVCRAADEIVLPKGTRLTLQLNAPLSTKNNKEGDVFDTLVINPVYLANQIVVPKGSTVSGSISRITRPGRFKGKAMMHLLFQSIQISGRAELPIFASLVRGPDDEEIQTEGTITGEGSKGGDIGKVAAPGLAGAGIGTLAGGGKGAAIGAGVGTAIGLANVFWTRGQDLELKRGSTIEITLEQPLKIPQKK